MAQFRGKPVETQKLAEIKDALVNWLCTPRNERVPSTRNDLAEHLGISRASLTRYERHPVIRDAVDSRLVELNVNPERVQALVDEMYRQATDMSLKPFERAKFMEMYFKYIGQLGAERPARREPRLEDMTDEEFAATVLQLVPKVADG